MEQPDKLFHFYQEGKESEIISVSVPTNIFDDALQEAARRAGVSVHLLHYIPPIAILLQDAVHSPESDNYGVFDDEL